MSNPAEMEYSEREERFAAEEGALARRSRTFSTARLVVFLAAAASLLAILVWGRQTAWLLLAAAILALVFSVLAGLHRRLEARRLRAARLREINREALARGERAWDRLPLPLPPADLAGVTGAVARDLDLFGRASLFHLLGTVRSPPGRAMLAAWLLTPAAVATIRARQEAVGELAARHGGTLDWRQELELQCLPLAAAEPDPEPFLAWAEGRPWLIARPWILGWARLTALATLPTIVAALYGALPWTLAALLPLANWSAAYLLSRRTDEVFDRVDRGQAGFVGYAAALTVLGERDFASEVLQRAASELAAGAEPAPLAMRRLARLVVLSDARHGSYVHFLLQSLFLWDVHLLARFERWQQRCGNQARAWLRALGEVEALAALGALAHDNPDWAMPTHLEGTVAWVTGEGLTHPLLRPDARVGNDVEIPPPGGFLLVTGSNMSGKSTLLRALGINVVLAQAGGPVCARRFELPPLVLGTSVLIEDSLADGYSFFMAELRRLKEIVRLAGESREEGGRTLLFLLDEVLRGTNASERRVAIRRVLLHLIDRGAIGAVSTHDLALAELEGLEERCLAVHFRETVHTGGDGPAMTFDYRLRPGVATTVNALKLLDLVGLGEDGVG